MADKNKLLEFANLFFDFQDKPDRPDFEELAHADPLRLLPWGSFSPYNPDSLVTRKGYRTLDEMRDDDQVKACMAFKKLAVTKSGYTVLSPDEQDDEWEVTKFVDKQFRKLPGTFNHVIYEILSAMDYGFSVSEKVFEEIEDGEFKGKIGFRAIKTRKPHYMGFKQDEFGNILNVLQYTTDGAFGEGKELPMYKFVIYSYMSEFDNPYGNSDLRAAYRHWWSKDHALKWLMLMLERYGIPPLFGLYDPEEIRGNELATLKTIFSRLQAATNVLLPALNGPSDGKGGNRAFELEFPEVAGQVATVFEPAINRFDTSIAKSLLMPGLLGMSPDQVSGSLARSKTSFDMFMLVLEFMRSEIEELVNEQIVRDLVDYNFNVDEYPIFSLNPINDDIRVDILKTWSELVGNGVVMPQDEDENHIRSMLDFPEAKMEDVEDDDLPDDEPDDDEPDDDDDDEPPPEFRQKTPFEMKVNFKKVAKFMEKNEAEAVKEIRAELEKAKFTLARTIRRNGVQADSLKSIRQLPGRQSVRRALQKYMVTSYRQGRADLRKELRKQMPSEFADDGPNYIPQEALTFLRQKAISITDVTDQAIIGAVKQSLSKSIELGETTQAATARLDDAFKPFVGKPGMTDDGSLQEPHRLENIVRTETTAAYNQGRLVEARSKSVVDRMRAMEYSAILDERTTPVCQSLDGKIFQIGDPNLDKLRPPNHFQCRSVLVPITVFDEIDERDIISPTESGKAIELAGKGFV